MIQKIIDWSINNKFIVLLGTLFLILGGIMALVETPVDAIPDLSDVQVIIYTEYPGQAPQVVEDQVTYPLSTAMLSVPYAKVVRGYSFFGLSFVYIIFEDGTDLYWARSRVLEYLNFVSRGRIVGASPSISMKVSRSGNSMLSQYSASSSLGRPEVCVRRCRMVMTGLSECASLR